MKVGGTRKIRLLRRSWLGLATLGHSFKSVRRIALAISVLSVFTATCLASETQAASQGVGATPLSIIRGGTVVGVDINGPNGIDMVMVEAEGRAPSGFRYRVVLGPIAHANVSSCELTAEEGGLLVTARDVDGIGNDFDLIIKSARSLVPVGVWINDHRGGFIKANAGVYARAIWDEIPLLVSDYPPASIQPAGLPSLHSCINYPTRRCPYEQLLDKTFVNSTNFAVPSRLTAGPHQTRAPPLALSAK